MDLILYNKETNKSELNPYLKDIKEFKNLIDIYGRDYQKWLSYIYLYTRFDSPYSGYDDDDKEKALLEDLELGESVPEVVIYATQRYEKLSEGPTARLLKSALISIEKMRTYLEGVDFYSTDKTGKFVYSPKDVISVLQKLGPLVDSINKLRDQVHKEMKTSLDIRGDVEITKYNE
jgi:hypothetical protein